MDVSDHFFDFSVCLDSNLRVDSDFLIDFVKVVLDLIFHVFETFLGIVFFSIDCIFELIQLGVNGLVFFIDSFMEFFVVFLKDLSKGFDSLFSLSSEFF